MQLFLKDAEQARLPRQLYADVLRSWYVIGSIRLSRIGRYSSRLESVAKSRPLIAPLSAKPAHRPFVSRDAY
ncbi:hypothetical protein EVAR_86601_1 [Eumeta japonica]|uniref:Uncharacterized protein n=1 Tax=Eumeta variegata TaxID=151549 RepID=A0A4C1VZU6_EUMVA|nr:hypothetical protein EVAR_86601_1 [Eumeta japonica]